MVNAMSCWVVDWGAIGAIGTWVGGIGAGAAAIAAVWAVSRESKRRTAYAKYLYENDVNLMRHLLTLLAEIESSLWGWERQEPGDDYVDKTLKDELKKFYQEIREFSYFGNIAEQFEFRPPAAMFNGLNSIYEEFKSLEDDISSLWFEHDMDAAASHVEDLQNRLKKLLERDDGR